jgi:hypothetical protein
VLRDGVPLATLIAGNVELIATLSPDDERAARKSLLREPDSTFAIESAAPVS